MGGSSKKQTVGYKYYLGIHMVLCRGPIDYISRIRIDEKEAFKQLATDGVIAIDKPNLFGGESREGGISGNVDLKFGDTTQTPNDYLQSVLGTNIPAFRTVVSAILRQVYVGMNPYLKKWDFRATRISTRQDGQDQWYPEKAGIPCPDDTVDVTPISLFDRNTYWNYKIVPWDDATDYSDGSELTSYGRAPFYYNLGGHPYISTSWTDNEPTGTDIGNKKDVWAKRTITLPMDSTVTFNFAVDNQVFLYIDGIYSGFSGIFETSTEISISKGNHEIVLWGNEVTDPPSYTFLDAESTYVPSYGDNPDMNPAHIIRECLTDPDWGMGYSESDMGDSFTTAADTLYSEQFGLSFIWDNQKPIEEFISDVLRHIDASLYVSRSTGKFEIKLIRNDYTKSELTLLDEDSIISVEDYSQVSFGELVNSVAVVYYNQLNSIDETVAAQDIALIQQQGGQIATTVRYPGIRNSSLASRVAQRDLKSLSSQLISCTVYATRAAANLNIGDPFVLYWPDYGINSVVMRVQTIAYGDGKTNQIKIQCAQDVFATPDSAIVAAPEAEYTEDLTALPTTIRLFTETPYYSLVQQIGQSTINDTLTNNSYASYAVNAAARPSESHIDADLLYDSGAGYSSEDTLTFCPVVELNESITPIQTGFYVSNVFDIDIIEAGGWCQCGDEVMRIDSVPTLDSTGAYYMTVGRGCLDTTPQSHTIDSSGKYIFFWQDYYGASNTEYSYGESILAKILTRTPTDSLLEADDTPDSLIIRSRPILPYPPGNLLIEGESYPDFVNADSAENVFIEWAHRDRLQQTGSIIYDHTEGDIGPEDGTTYTVRLFNEFGGLESESTGISVTNVNVSLIPLITDIARIDVVSVRDGFESWMAASHTFQWNFIDSGLSDSAPYDSAGSYIDITDPYFSYVTALLHFNGSDASTTITDEIGNTWTASGNAQLDTANSKYGTSSLLLDGTTDYIYGDNSTNLQLGSGDWTLEFFVYFNTLSSLTRLYDGRATANGPYPTLQVDATNIVWIVNATQVASGAHGMSTGTWYHIAACKASGSLRLFVDGVQKGTTYSDSVTYTNGGSTRPLLGADGFSLGDKSVDGWIDDVRITKGYARYATAFTPPSTQFPDS